MYIFDDFYVAWGHEDSQLPWPYAITKFRCPVGSELATKSMLEMYYLERDAIKKDN